MAAIDKIFARTKEEFLEFYTWCDKFRKICRKETGKDIMGYFYVTPDSYDERSRRYSDGLVPITNFPTVIDKWLAKHCPVSWVRERYPYIGEGCKENEIKMFIDK